MYITKPRDGSFLGIGFGKVKSDALSDQLITFARFPYETLPIKYRDLPSGALNQTCTLQVPGSTRISDFSVAPPGIAMNDVFQAALPYVWFGLLALAAVFLFPPLATWLPGLIG